MTSERNGGRERDEATAMPMVPESLRIDPLLLALLHLASVLDFADDDALDGDVANEALEAVEGYVQRLPAERLEAIQADLDRIEEYGAEQGWAEEMTDFVRDFLYNCGLGEDDEEPSTEDS